MLWQQQYVEPYVKEINNTKVNDVKKQKTKKKDKKKIFRFKIGDMVRISHLRSLFQRKYDQK
jgi:transcription antitermination factor NusG